jgi:hypothetical protein
MMDEEDFRNNIIRDLGAKDTRFRFPLIVLALFMYQL